MNDFAVPESHSVADRAKVAPRHSTATRVQRRLAVGSAHDPLELAADRLANDVMSSLQKAPMPPPAASGSSRVVRNLTPVDAGSRPKPAVSRIRPGAPTGVQRVYERPIGTQLKDAEAEYLVLDNAVAATATLNDVQAEWNAIARQVKVDTIKRLMKWGGIGGINPLSFVTEAVAGGEPAKVFEFHDEEDAVRCVIAETKRAAGETKERAMANEVLTPGGNVHTQVLEGLQRYMGRLATYVQQMQGLGYIGDDFLKKRGKYGSYYQSWNFKTMGDVLADARSYRDIGPLIAAVKDITSEFWSWLEREIETGTAAGGVAHAAWLEADTAINVPDAQRVAGHRAGGGALMSEPIDTVRPDAMNEKSESMKAARRHGMLVEVGPSYSTGRLLQLGARIGAQPEEQEAVALAIFAFWNKPYWRATSGIHHYHYVMDMLENYVPGTYDYNGYPASVQASMSNLLNNISATPIV